MDELKIDGDIVVIIIIGFFLSAGLIRTLNFVIKSRCTSIKCCGNECSRDVISQENLDKNIIKEIEIPKNLVNIKK